MRHALSGDEAAVTRQAFLGRAYRTLQPFRIIILMVLVNCSAYMMLTMWPLISSKVLVASSMNTPVYNKMTPGKLFRLVVI